MFGGRKSPTVTVLTFPEFMQDPLRALDPSRRMQPYCYNPARRGLFVVESIRPDWRSQVGTGVILYNGGRIEKGLPDLDHSTHVLLLLAVCWISAFPYQIKARSAGKPGTIGGYFVAQFWQPGLWVDSAPNVQAMSPGSGDP